MLVAVPAQVGNIKLNNVLFSLRRRRFHQARVTYLFVMHFLMFYFAGSHMHMQFIRAFAFLSTADECLHMMHRATTT